MFSYKHEHYFLFESLGSLRPQNTDKKVFVHAFFMPVGKELRIKN